MIDFDHCDPADLDMVGVVVADLVDVGFASDGGLMLIGAECRNIIHRALGHAGDLRSTTDVDFGFAVGSWEDYDRLTGTLTRTGASDVRFAVGGHAVDLVPFGTIEDPTGTVPASGRRDALDVFAFDGVFETAHLVPSGPNRIRLPTPAGYTALKMKAWIDRSVRHEDRDARDLAVCLRWYQGIDDLDDEIHGDDGRGERAMQIADFDLQAAAAALLGVDVSHIIGDERARALRDLWYRSDLRELARIVAGERRRRGWGRVDETVRDVEMLGAGLDAST